MTARRPSDQNPEQIFRAFLVRLPAIRVLDPACGTGNFLYISLQLLKDLEHSALGFAASPPSPDLPPGHGSQA